MRNIPFFYQTLFQSFPWPCYYNCHSHCFTVISYLIKVRAWQKAPKEIVGLPVLHFAGGLMDCFQKKKHRHFSHFVCTFAAFQNICWLRLWTNKLESWISRWKFRKVGKKTTSFEMFWIYKDDQTERQTEKSA